MENLVSIVFFAILAWLGSSYNLSLYNNPYTRINECVICRTATALAEQSVKAHSVLYKQLCILDSGHMLYHYLNGHKSKLI